MMIASSERKVTNGRRRVNAGRPANTLLSALLAFARWLLDRPMPYPPYGKIVLICFVLAFIVGVAALYVASVLAVHATIALNSATSIAPASKRTNPRVDAAVAGFVAGAIWTLVVALGTYVASGTANAWLVGLGLGAPVGCVIGWEIATWQEALSWSRQPGSLNLGVWREGPFFVARVYAVTPGERLKHVFCSGPTGSGKSTLIRNMVLQDLKAGAGVCVIDPKDDLVDGLLPHIPRSRIDDVILFDATDRERPLGLNPLGNVSQEQKSLAASELIAVFRRYFSEAWGPRLEHILRHVVLALLDMPETTLLDIPRLLLDARFARTVAEHVSNPAVREFFNLELPELARGRGTAIGPILNKVGPWLAYPELRNIIGQVQSSFELRDVMDAGKVLLVRIPQGGLGEDVSSLLGSLIVAKVQLAAQSRVDTPAQARRPFYLYVDEFQNFATTSFAKIVTEARAFGLGLVCANQFPEQLSRDLRLTLINNAATFVLTEYRRGRYFAEVTRREDLGRAYGREFTVNPPPPLPVGDEARAAAVREMSRERYGARPLTDIRDHGDPAKRSVGGEDRPDWGEDLDEE